MRRTTLLSGLLLFATLNASEQMKMAILEPVAKPTVAGQKESTTVQEAAERVIPRLIVEAHKKFKPRWNNVEFVPYEQARAVQKEVLVSYSLDINELIPPSLLKLIAQRLQCRYIVQSVVAELTGARSIRLTAQRTGRVVIDIYVYDAVLGRYVWHDSRTQTSTRTDWYGASSLKQVQDQALLNALREGLEPFVLRGERREVAIKVGGVVANLKSIVKETGAILLDVGSEGKVYIGMEFVSLDGKCRLRIKEVLSNGSIAEVVEGTPEVGQVFKSVD